jgi:two-component system, NtrC family, response regulator HydG
MKPRLAAITGKLKDTVIAMSEGPVLIGRQTGASLRIRNAAVSRRHAVIEKDGDKYIIADLDSRNGTFVNDMPVKRCELHHGDRVQIGESQFFFLIDDIEDPSQTSEIRFDEAPLLGSPAVRMTYSDAVFVMARDLSALLKISTTINAIRDLDKLEKALLDLLFEVVPARRGAILLTGNHANTGDEFSSVITLDRVEGVGQTVNVSRTIVRRVLNDGAAILIN